MFSVKKLVRELGIEPAVAAQIRDVMRNNKDIQKAMDVIDGLLDTYGIEVLYSNGGWRPRAAYCNNGETYRTTVLYDLDKDKYRLISWGDYAVAHRL